MIINADFVNQHCHKKLGYYDLDKMKIHDAEEIFINFEINILNNLSVYTDIIKNCLPNNLRKLELDKGVFLNEINNFPETLEELYLKGSEGKINISLPNLKKIIAVDMELNGNYEKLEVADVYKISQIPDSLKKLDVYEYDNDSRNIEELEIKMFKGGILGEKLIKLEIGYFGNEFEFEENVFDKCFNLIELKIFYLKQSGDFFKNCQNLKKLKIRRGDQNILNHLPKNLEELEFNSGIACGYHNSYKYIELNNLPASLKKLKLENMKSNLEFLPQVEELDINCVFGKFLNLPGSLKKFKYLGLETEIIVPENIEKMIHFANFDDDDW